MANTMNVSVSVNTAAHIIEQEVVEGSITGTLIDRYEIESSDKKKCVMLVFDKHYYRAGNRLTLTVLIDDFTGVTRVHCVAGGGGEGLFRFDWGAAESFEEIVFEALEKYIVW